MTDIEQEAIGHVRALTGLMAWLSALDEAKRPEEYDAAQAFLSRAEQSAGQPVIETAGEGAFNPDEWDGTVCSLVAEIERLQPYRDELLKIAESLGEPDDPFAAWESLEAINVELSTLRSKLAELEAETIERCAIHFVELAEFKRQGAETLRRDWCGPEMEYEDRRANYQDAREHDALAAEFDRVAAAIRALKPQGERT